MNFFPVSKGSGLKRWLPLALAMVLAYLAFVVELPNNVPFAPHDDGLFIRQALSIAHGEWLGQVYDEFTLAKGSFHSVVLALGHLLGLEAGLWVRLIYAVSALLFCTLGLARASLLQRALSAVFLLLDPWVFTNHGTRLLRDSTYISLGLIAMAFSLAAIDRLPLHSLLLHSKQEVAEPMPGWLQPARLGLAGLALGLMLITREARVVVMVTLGSILVAWFVTALSVRLSRNYLRSAFACALALVLVVPLPLLSVAWANRQSYGLAITNEFEEGAFKVFYQDLLSVQPSGTAFLPWVPVRQSTLSRLIGLAPSSELAQTLGALDPLWTTYGCFQHPSSCGEYGGGWFMWALRQAMFKVGALDSPLGFQQMVLRLHRELNMVCSASGAKLDCTPKASGYLPRPQRWGHGRRTAARVFRTTGQLVFGLINPPLIDELPRPYQAQNPGWRDAERLGVVLPHGARLERYDQRLGIRYWMAVGVRAILILLVLLWLVRHHRSAGLAITDPGVWILLCFVVVQSAVLILIQITSFNIESYLAMVSPFFVSLLCRMMFAAARPSPALSCSAIPPAL